jgi:hypothetical protein
VDLAALIWFAPFAAIGIRAVRGLAWWPIVAAITVARLVAGRSGEPAPRERVDPPLMRRLNLVVAGALVVAGIALLPAWRPVEPGLDAPAGVVATSPPGITEALRELVGPDDRLFAPQPWGSWFEFALPGTPVFIDSRIELFPVAIWDDYDVIIDGGTGWSETLDRWQISVVVAVDRLGRTPLTDRLAGDAGWLEVYRDDDGRVFIRASRSAGLRLSYPSRAGTFGAW